MVYKRRYSKCFVKNTLLSVFLIIIFILCAFFMFSGAKMLFHLDLSQDYQEIEGVENIIFLNNQGQLYKRTFWGLKRIDGQTDFYEQNTEEQELLIAELKRSIYCENTIDLAIFSPDRRYILYREIAYNYNRSDMTDDEYCYYRIYDINTSKITTIYKGYREWFKLDWQ